MTDPTFYAGTSGLQSPIPKRDFPPAFADKSRLTYYSSLFNSVEINSSFYKLPIAKTLARWAEEVPEDFRFTFKLWKEITHNKNLVFPSPDIATFIERINSVGAKKGALLVQFPPSLTKAVMPQLVDLLSSIKESDQTEAWPIAVEFRHRSWYEETTYELLNSFGATMVIHDLPASAAPMQSTEANHIYFRFHGPNGDYRGSYDDDFLAEYASYIREFQEEGKTVYAYFNNTVGNALGNLSTLIDELNCG
ncbi:DUF72 domain-containing protein [Mucilaginibacter gynuensis]|uniref:DUF72 domain-containing protein n=1 Tax=Mucilaginibacter gynuensis TaxID=1302236 RepID=A0ABP8GNK3_9SPHI